MPNAVGGPTRSRGSTHACRAGGDPVLRWPWRRSAPPAVPPGPPPSADVPPSRAPRTPAWHRVAPLQRVVGSMPLTAPVERLTPSLSSWADPRFTTALGHVVDPDGPSGRVSGLVEPVPPRAAPGTASPPDLILFPPPPSSSPSWRDLASVQALHDPTPLQDSTALHDPTALHDSTASGRPTARE